jgi:hypothetical protein
MENPYIESVSFSGVLFVDFSQLRGLYIRDCISLYAASAISHCIVTLPYQNLGLIMTPSKNCCFLQPLHWWSHVTNLTSSSWTLTKSRGQLRRRLGLPTQVLPICPCSYILCKSLQDQDIGLDTIDGVREDFCWLVATGIYCTICIGV